jgi:hypothetical protein
MIVYEEPRALLRAEEQTLLTPINIDVAGGGGLPQAFRYGYPGLHEAYTRAYTKRVFDNDGLFVFEASPLRKILCLPTKQHRQYSSQEKLDYLEESLRVVAMFYPKYGITSLAIDELGGLELAWSDVEPIIYRCLHPIDLPVGLCREPVHV